MNSTRAIALALQVVMVTCAARWSAGADVTTRPATTTRAAGPPLSAALATGDYKRAMQLIRAGADVNEREPDHHSAALHFAFGRRWSAEVVKELVNRGADVNSRGIGEFTPLHSASFYGADAATVDLLISKGADVNAREHAGFTPLHVAATCGKGTVAAALIAHGANVNAVADDGRTPLDMARAEKNNALADLLIAAGGKKGKNISTTGPTTKPK